MAKFYAIKVGKKPGIYTTWEEAKEQVQGFSGAKHKSFKTIEEAKDYLFNYTEETKKEIKNINESIEEKIKELNNNEMIAFIDGSYSEELKKYSFGSVIITKENKEERCMAFNNEEYLSSRNVAGEIMGVMYALKEACVQKKQILYVYYDYEGIEKWATGEWKAQIDLTRWYRDVFWHSKMENNLKVKFIHVKAHSGIKYNEVADKLAKQALENL